MSEQLYLNGIDADTGGPLDGDTVITSQMIASVARGQTISKEELDDARMRKYLDKNKQPEWGVIEGVDDNDLGSAGWSIIMPASLPQKSVDGIKDALKPLLDLRREQASAQNEVCYREVIGPDQGYRSGETKNDFLTRFGRGPGAANPELFPYYTLIVGSPETIPFGFQYQLDVQYAVGRIYFDRLEDYYQYASSVVAAENKKILRAKTAAFFGVSNPDDRATAMSSTQLIQPLASQMKTRYPDWAVDLINPQDATKSNLTNYIGGAKTPALMFSASHGMSFKPGDVRQLRHTGAILTQDWPGPNVRGPVSDSLYFSADDVSSDADVFGMLAFIFACYGGGIPKSDNFYRQAFAQKKDIAPYAFLAALPLRLLSHPKGGALGVFAHVERAWGSSIQWDGAVNDIETFDSTVAALLKGKPAGAATEYFNSRYAEISTMLTEELGDTTPETQDDIKLAGMWTSNNDARNYTFIGDPAVRLAVGDAPTSAGLRASISVTSIPASVTAASPSFQPDIVDRAALTAASAAAAQPAPAGSAAPAGSTAPASYAFWDGLQKKDTTTPDSAAAGAGGALRNFMENLGTYLSKALDDALSLEVYTFVADDLNTVNYTDGKFSGAELRAVTRINIDGDTRLCIPEKDGEVDMAVWGIHLEMVKSAQANRAELMKTIMDAAVRIAGIGH
jgi:hypothetical protein